MTSVEGLLGKVRLQIAKRCVRLKDSFQDFDKLRTGSVTNEQARRVLGVSGVLPALSDADFATLANEYPGNGPDRFHYTAFLTDVDRVEVAANSAAENRHQTLDAAEDAILAKATKQFIHLMTVKSLDVTLRFKDFDKHNVGKVTDAQFQRSFPFNTEASVMDLLKKKYSDGLGNVHYKHWVDDLRSAAHDAKNEGDSSPTALSPTAQMMLSQCPKRTLTETDELLAELRNQFAANRIRIDDTMRDHDKTHSGTIGASQFKGALGSVKLVHFVLTNDQLNALVRRYEVPSEDRETRVAYRRFLADVGDADAAVSPVRRNPNGTVNTLSDAEEQICQRVLDKVRSTVRTRRMNMKPTFQDFDRASKGIYQCRTCTRTRFQRALATNKVNLLPSEMALLEKKYSVVLPGEGDSDAINYVAFCADVDVNDRVEPISMPDRSAATKVEKKTEVDLQAVLKSIAEQCALRRLRLKEFFRDFDPLRHLSVAEDKFGSALSMASVKLSQEQIQVLCQAYADPNLSGSVKYPPFAQDVDKYQDALDLTGTMYQQPRANDEVEARQLEEIHNRIAKTVKGRGILLPPFFRDYDRHHCGRITAIQFSQTISRHRFPVSQSEVELLMKHYACPEDTAMVRYRPFLAAIDESEDTNAQHKARLATRPELKNDAPPPPKQDPEELMHSISQKIKGALLRGARIEEFLRDTDGLRKGYVTSGKFCSALDMVGTHFSDAEVEYVTSTYANSSVPDTVNYVAFLKDVRQMTEDPNFLKTTVDNTLGSDNPFLKKTIEKIRKHKQTTRRSATAELFRDFDKLRKGRVTQPQFHAVMTGVGVRLNAQEVNALNEALSCGNGEMNYLAFSRLVDQ